MADGPTRTAGPAAPAASITELAPGARLGRYIIEAKLGQGATGAVYAARDAELNREVALKLLSGDSLVQQGRALGEAKALARVSHPNVVSVYDVGTAAGAVYIAMERLRGSTLGAWLDAELRPWREVLKVCLQAGRGVAAAHAAGLVHRDIKPSNVLVEPSGRVAVTDFGLARVLAAEGDQDGAGTPAYMAPEQRARGKLGPWTDQYAFCLMTFGALFGRATRGGPAPGALSRCLERGLARDPDRRFPSMDALLQALERAGRPVLRPLALLVGGSVVVVTAAAALLSRAQACRSTERSLDGVWDEPSRQAVRGAFHASGAPEAAAAFEGVGAALDAYRREYLDAAERACRAARARTGDEESRRSLCLTHRRRELTAMVALLRTADRALLPRAADAARALRPVAQCEDRARLRRQPPLPVDPLARQASESVRERLATATALRLAARFSDARAVYQTALAQAEAAGDHALVADVLLGLQACLGGQGDIRGARALLERAALEAESARHDEAAARARVDLLGTVVKLDSTGDLESASRAAQASVQRLGGDPELEILLLHELANVASARFDRATTLARFQEAMALTEREFPGDLHLNIIAANNVGATLGTLGRYREALALQERALGWRVQRLGAGHLDVAGSIHNIARVLSDAGRLDEALAREREALARWEPALGASHPRVGRARQILAEILLRLGRAAEARPPARSALAVSEATVGRDQLEQVPLLSLLGVVHGELGAWAEADASHRRAVALAERVGPIGRAPLSAALIARAETAWLRGELDEALDSAKRGKDLAEGLWGAGSGEAQRARAVLGAALVDGGRAAEAKAALEEALAPAPEPFSRTALPRCWALAALAEARRQEGDAAAQREVVKELLAECRPGRAHPAAAALGRLSLARRWREEGAGGDRALAEVAIGELERAPAGYRRFAEQARRWVNGRGP